MAREGLDPFEVCLMIILWQFWWISDLASCGFLLYAWLGPLATILLAMLVMYCLKETIIFPVVLGAKVGLLFILLTSHPYFYSTAATDNCEMSGRTKWLQLSLFAFVVILSGLFYSEYFSDCFRCSLDLLNIEDKADSFATCQNTCRVTGRVVSRDGFAPLPRRDTDF